ncbi:MAG: hypothetical protein ACXVBW_10050, partial [Bdellovibrionota bacterium]
SASARGYGIYLKFGYLNRHFSASGSWTKGDGRRVFGEVIRESIHFLEDQIRKKPGQVLTFDELNLLLVALEPLRPESLEVSTPTLQAALKPVIKKLLGGGPYAKGLTVGVLENVNASIEHWHYGQKYLERLFDWLAVRGGVQSSYVRSELLLPELEDLLVEKPKGAELDAISKIQEMIADPRERPLFEDSEGAVSFSQIPFADYERHTFYDLTQMNWMHEVVRAMLRAYSDDGRSEQVSNVKLQEFYNDFRDVGIEEKLFDPFDEMAAQKRFTEANLFTYAANGDGYIDVQEGSQLLAFMISGEQLAGQIRREITAVCRDPENQFDIYGKAMMRTDCFRREFFEGANRYWKFMPRMADYYRRLDWIGKKRFEHAFEAAARKKGFSSDKIDSADCEGFAMIAHYSESLFARWDSNLSGDIDEKEAEAMFPVFRNTILEVWQKRVRGVKPTEGRLKAAFTYILGKGEIPDASHFKDKLKFIFWDLGSQKFTADRGRILQIFADLGMLEEMPNTP